MSSHCSTIRQRARVAEDKYAKSGKILADIIFDIVLSKKFRKYSVSEEYKKEIRAAIELNLSRQLPIQFAFPYGGYKLWRLAESPEPDWAELFSLAYFAEWLVPIASFYAPGVWFDFSSSDINVEYANNIPRADLDLYAHEFERLIEFIAPNIPSNFTFSFTRVRSRYDENEFQKELNQKMVELSRTYKNELPELTEKEKKAIELNVKIEPGQNKDSSWMERNKLMYDAYHALSKVRPYYRAPGKIVVSASSGRASVPVGTVKTSIVKFQVGVGALEQRGDNFMPRILSPEQLANKRFVWETTVIPGLAGKNFHKIRILNESIATSLQ